MLASPTQPPAAPGTRTSGRSAGPGAVRCGGAAELGELSFASPASPPSSAPAPWKTKQGRGRKSLLGPYRGRAVVVGGLGLIRHERWQAGEGRGASGHAQKKSC